MEIKQLLIAYLVGLFGMLMNWLVNYNKKTFDLNLWQYVKTNSVATVKALAATLVTVVTVLQTGMIDLANIQGFFTIFLAGYAIDNSINSPKNR